MAVALSLYHLQADLLAQQGAGGPSIFAAAVAHPGARVGRKTYLVDMATQENRAQFTAVSNTVIGLVLLLGILLGVLDTYAGVGAVVVVLILLGVMAAVRAVSLPNVQQR